MYIFNIADSSWTVPDLWMCFSTLLFIQLSDIMRKKKNPITFNFLRIWALQYSHSVVMWIHYYYFFFLFKIINIVMISDRQLEKIVWSIIQNKIWLNVVIAFHFNLKLIYNYSDFLIHLFQDQEENVSLINSHKRNE